MIEKLQPNIMEDWSKAKNITSSFEDIIVQRLDYILHTIAEAFGKRIEYWYYDGASEGEVGDITKHIYGGEIETPFIQSSSKFRNMIVILNNGDEWGFEESIPYRWLFEDFEQELSDGVAKYKEKQIKIIEANKIKKENKKLEDAMLIKAAKAKLTKEEFQALKRNS